MAKKREPTMEDAIKVFKDVMQRASFSSYYHVNKIMLSINDKDNKILIIPDQELWNSLIDHHKAVKMKCSDCNIEFYAAIGEFTKDDDGYLLTGPVTCIPCLEQRKKNLLKPSDVVSTLPKDWSEDKKKEWLNQVDTMDKPSPLRDIIIKELDITNRDQCGLNRWFIYGEDHLSKDWIPIDVENSLHTGKIFKIKMKDLEYKIPINRDLMPLKLKKAEYEGVSYRIFTKPLLLAINKRFESPKDVDGGGFNIIRLFQVI